MPSTRIRRVIDARVTGTSASAAVPLAAIPHDRTSSQTPSLRKQSAPIVKEVAQVESRKDTTSFSGSWKGGADRTDTTLTEVSNAAVDASPVNDVVQTRPAMHSSNASSSSSALRRPTKAMRGRVIVGSCDMVMDCTEEQDTLTVSRDIEMMPHDARVNVNDDAQLDRRRGVTITHPVSAPNTHNSMSPSKTDNPTSMHDNKQSNNNNNTNDQDDTTHPGTNRRRHTGAPSSAAERELLLHVRDTGEDCAMNKDDATVASAKSPTKPRIAAPSWRRVALMRACASASAASAVSRGRRDEIGDDVIRFDLPSSRKDSGSDFDANEAEEEEDDGDAVAASSSSSSSFDDRSSASCASDDDAAIGGVYASMRRGKRSRASALDLEAPTEDYLTREEAALLSSEEEEEDVPEDDDREPSDEAVGPRPAWGSEAHSSANGVKEAHAGGEDNDGEGRWEAVRKRVAAQRCHSNEVNSARFSSVPQPPSMSHGTTDPTRPTRLGHVVFQTYTPSVARDMRDTSTHEDCAHTDSHGRTNADHTSNHVSNTTTTKSIAEGKHASSDSRHDALCHHTLLGLNSPTTITGPCGVIGLGMGELLVGGFLLGNRQLTLWSSAQRVVLQPLASSTKVAAAPPPPPTTTTTTRGTTTTASVPKASALHTVSKKKKDRSAEHTEFRVDTRALPVSEYEAMTHAPGTVTAWLPTDAMHIGKTNTNRSNTCTSDTTTINKSNSEHEDASASRSSLCATDKPSSTRHDEVVYQPEAVFGLADWTWVYDTLSAWQLGLGKAQLSAMTVVLVLQPSNPTSRGHHKSSNTRNMDNKYHTVNDEGGMMRRHYLHSKHHHTIKSTLTADYVLVPCFFARHAEPVIALRPTLSLIEPWGSAGGRACPPGAVMVVGSQGVGKSTLCRFLANALLSRYGVCLWLDLDLGQPEFDVPGQLALFRLCSPLLRAQERHAASLVKSYFLGHITPQCPRSTAQALAVLCGLARYLAQRFPVVVNTHGWVLSTGRRTTLEAMRRVQPKHVIHLMKREEEDWLNAERNGNHNNATHDNGKTNNNNNNNSYYYYNNNGSTNCCAEGSMIDDTNVGLNSHVVAQRFLVRGKRRDGTTSSTNASSVGHTQSGAARGSKPKSTYSYVRLSALPYPDAVTGVDCDEHENATSTRKVVSNGERENPSDKSNQVHHSSNKTSGNHRKQRDEDGSTASMNDNSGSSRGVAASALSTARSKWNGQIHAIRIHRDEARLRRRQSTLCSGSQARQARWQSYLAPLLHYYEQSMSVPGATRVTDNESDAYASDTTLLQAPLSQLCAIVLVDLDEKLNECNQSTTREGGGSSTLHALSPNRLAAALEHSVVAVQFGRVGRTGNASAVTGDHAAHGGIDATSHVPRVMALASMPIGFEVSCYGYVESTEKELLGSSMNRRGDATDVARRAISASSAPSAGDQTSHSWTDIGPQSRSSSRLSPLSGMGSIAIRVPLPPSTVRAMLDPEEGAVGISIAYSDALRVDTAFMEQYPLVVSSSQSHV